MPEGDSIYKVAARLRPALVGKPLTRLELRERGPVPSVVGRRVLSVEARGKHMFVRIEPRWVVHVHLGMNGRWRTFADAASRSFPRSALAVFGTGTNVYVCFSAAFARLRTIDDPSVRRVFETLGPDILDPDVDLERIVQRSLAVVEGTVARVITDQRVVAGLGNVYKSEVLFLCGMHPLTPAASVSAGEWTAIYRCAAELMRANLISGPRSSTATHKAGRHPPGIERLWVYRRRAAPCLRCGTPIERSVTGDTARSTYWCPRCQPERRDPQVVSAARPEDEDV